jgi:L-ribulose-5-phosphate 4-epimerase
MPMVIVASHGPFAWGDTPEDAVYHAEMLEHLAKTALLTLQVNPEVPRLNQRLVDKHYERKHGPGAYYGQGAIRNERGTRR